jgi:hypothetical protein
LFKNESKEVQHETNAFGAGWESHFYYYAVVFTKTLT